MTSDDRTETITDRAAIRDSDEPSERGDFPCCSGARATSETVSALDLDAIEARAKAANVEARCSCSLQSGAAYNSGCPLHDPSSTIRHDRVAFESHAHDDVPALVAEVRSLRAKVAAVEALAESGTTPDGEPLPEWVSVHDLRAALATGEGK